MSKPLPGKGRIRNLVNMDTYEQCPCCGAVHKVGRPWSTAIMTVPEFAKMKGISQQAVKAKCRKGIIAAYQGMNGHWLIPIIEPD
jgi:hypothetical protein